MKIFVGNLPNHISEEELEKMFTPFGVVASVKIISDSYSGRSRGFGFVDMPVSTSAELAIKNLNNTILDSRSLNVNQARPEEAHHSGIRKH